MARPYEYVRCDSGERYSIAEEMASSRDGSGMHVCGQVEAEKTLMWLEDYVVPGALGSGEGVYTLNRFELLFHHGILTHFIPDDTRSTEGSIHRRIEELLGVSLVHTVDEARNCAVVTKWTRLTLTRE